MQLSSRCFPAVPPMAGIVAGIMLGAGTSFVTTTAVVIAGIIIFYFAQQFSASGRLYFAGALALGFITTAVSAPGNPPAGVLDGDTHRFRAEVLSASETDGRQRLIVRVDSGGDFNALLPVNNSHLRYYPGDCLRLTAKAVLSKAQRDVPFRNSLSGLSESWSTILFSRSEAITLVSSRTTCSSTAARLRERIADEFRSSGLSRATSGVLTAAWIGGDGIDSSDRALFRSSGLAHLLCVSGFHLCIIVALLDSLLRLLNLFPSGRKLRYIILIAAIWIYGALTGMNAPVIRAALMFTIYFFARITERFSTPLNSLAAAIFIMLALNPRWLFSIGFELSVCAIASILLIEPRINPVSLHPSTSRIHGLVSVITVPIAVLIGTAPVMILHFNQIQFAGLFTNIIAALIFPVFMCVGALYVLLNSVGLTVGPIRILTELLHDAIINLCSSASEAALLRTEIHLTEPAILAVALFVIALTVILNSRSRRMRLGAIFAAIACMGLYGCTAQHTERMLVIYSSADGARIETTRKPSAQIPDKVIIAGNKVVIRASRQFDPAGYSRLRHADYIVVDRDFSSSAYQSLILTKPKFVVLAPMSEKQKNEMIKLCNERDIPVIDLAFEAVYVPY